MQYIVGPSLGYHPEKENAWVCISAAVVRIFNVICLESSWKKRLSTKLSPIDGSREVSGIRSGINFCAKVHLKVG
jgi:hypothetical protein